MMGFETVRSTAQEMPMMIAMRMRPATHSVLCTNCRVCCESARSYAIYTSNAPTSGTISCCPTTIPGAVDPSSIGSDTDCHAWRSGKDTTRSRSPGLSRSALNPVVKPRTPVPTGGSSIAKAAISDEEDARGISSRTSPHSARRADASSVTSAESSVFWPEPTALRASLSTSSRRDSNRLFWMTRAIVRLVTKIAKEVSSRVMEMMRNRSERRHAVAIVSGQPRQSRHSATVVPVALVAVTPVS